MGNDKHKATFIDLFAYYFEAINVKVKRTAHALGIGNRTGGYYRTTTTTTTITNTLLFFNPRRLKTNGDTRKALQSEYIFRKILWTPTIQYNAIYHYQPVQSRYLPASICTQ